MYTTSNQDNFKQYTHSTAVKAKVQNNNYMDLISKSGMYSRMSQKSNTAVENNCVSQTKISMRFEIAKSK